jgi:hypothetical protein
VCIFFFAGFVTPIRWALSCRPLGFDLEWRVIWRPGAGECRTALVQLCDERIILLVQVSSMKREFLNLIPSMRTRLDSFPLQHCAGFPQKVKVSCRTAFLFEIDYSHNGMDLIVGHY